jgi:hypothetical protein
MERAKGFEPSTPTLARLCSTPELRPRILCCLCLSYRHHFAGHQTSRPSIGSTPTVLGRSFVPS